MVFSSGGSSIGDTSDPGEQNALLDGDAQNAAEGKINSIHNIL